MTYPCRTKERFHAVETLDQIIHRKSDPGLRQRRTALQVHEAKILVHQRIKNLYPLKYIYAMAIGSPPSSFNSSKPVSEFPAYGFQPIRKTEDPNEEFERKVLASLKDSKGRAAKLKEASAIPVTRIVSTIVFIRNPDVVAEMLAQANGVCSLCNQKAPFKRKKDQSPYLEVHHRKRLADGGEDTVAHAIAICPNCHRKAHHG
ncbi:HNH endonuclease [Pseudomonas viridiflava]|uniref:HNH endonuclease n=1 Tax=Pseudomonas viridiflava TaxID=33069 RepID=UPI001F1217D2|nr:HNH endonuclease signature motif containing protein [Pseudomonas viridiflava]